MLCIARLHILVPSIKLIIKCTGPIDIQQACVIYKCTCMAHFGGELRGWGVDLSG